MDKKDISLLVLNSIKDEKRIIDNYDFYNETDSEGLNSDAFKAKCYIGSLESYYEGSPRLEDTLSFLHSYYEPYVQQYEIAETPEIERGKRLVRIFFPGAAISTAATAFASIFYPAAFTISAPIALATSALLLISHLYVKTEEMQRAGRLKHLKINDAEAKSLTRQELSDFLDSDKEIVLEALATVYPC
ncbi:MAG: hypothetical protein WC852_02470 [Candidatus Nanoarchaeia archaeon]|jgi:hypothetical protein